MHRIIAAAVFAVMASLVNAAAGWTEESTVQLKEVVVTATRTEKLPQDVTLPVTVITAEEIKQSGATNVAEVVRTAAGVLINDQGPRGGLETISIRGARYSQVLVLLDGIRMNSPRDAGFDLSALPVSLDDIERIEVVYGPSSALYGADAVGGVVQIITKRPETREAKISGSAGSHGYDSFSAGYARKQGGLSYQLSAEKQMSDGYRLNSDFEQGTFNAKIGYELTERSSVELTGNYITKVNGVPGSTDLPSLLARQWDKQGVAGLGYTLRLSKGFDIKLNASYNLDILTYKNPDYFVNSSHKSATTGAEVQVNWLANSWNSVTAGLETKKDRLNSTDSSVHSTTLVAGYIQDEINLVEPVIVILGGRYDSHSAYGEQFSPRVSARYLVPGAGTIIRASAGESFRAPTFNDLYWKDPWSAGNPDLKPEKSIEYELAVEQPLGKGNVLKMSAFDRKVTDLINWVYDVFPMHPENIGKAHVRGGELESRFQLAEPLTGAISYTVTDSRDDLTGQRIYNIPQYEVKSHLNLAFPAKANVYFEGRMARNYVKPGEDTWAYSVFDGKVTQAVSFGTAWKGEWFLSVKNIFDRKYALARSYDFMTGNHSGDYPMPPREVVGGVSLQF